MTGTATATMRRRRDLRRLPLPWLVVAAVLPFVLIGVLAWWTLATRPGG